MLPIFKGKGYALSCGAYRGVKLLEHAMKNVEKVLEKGLRRRVKVDKCSIPEVMVRAVMSLYEGSKTRVRVGLELFEEFEVKVGVHQRSVLLLLVFVMLVDVVMKCVRNSLMNEMFYGDGLVLTSEMMEGLREKFWK